MARMASTIPNPINEIPLKNQKNEINVMRSSLNGQLFAENIA